MTTRTARQVEALRTFEAAREQLLAAHGARWTERSRITLDARPGVFALLEADPDVGERVCLLLACDEREPEAFGRRLDLEA